MATDDDAEIKKDAQEKAIYAEATKTVFNARASTLVRLTKVRDFLGLALPILLAFWLGSDIYEPLRSYRIHAIGLLSVGVVAQGLLALWSLVSRWDSQLAYSTRAGRDQDRLRERWSALAKGLTGNTAIAYAELNVEQALADSHDNEQGISNKEKQTGMRAGLILFKKACVCKQVPTSYSTPFRPKNKCAVCGGN